MNPVSRTRLVRFNFSGCARRAFAVFAVLACAAVTLGFADLSQAATPSPLHQGVHDYQIIGLIVLIALAALVVVGIFWNRRLVAENKSRMQAEQLLVTMTENLPTAVFQFKRTPDNRIVRTFMNKMARKMVRVAVQLPSSKRSRFFEFVHPDDAEAVRKTVDSSLVTGNPIRSTFRYRFPNEEWGWVFAEASVHTDEEGSAVWSGYMYDQTSERSINNALNESLLSKDDFIARAGHELRSPIQNLLLGIESLKRTGLNQEQVELLGLTHNAAQGLAGQINNLLDLNRIEAHELALEERSIEIRALLSKVTSKFEACAARKRLSFVCEVEQAVPTFVRCDPMRLEQVLSNLLANGLRHTDDGFVRIAVQVDGYLRGQPAGDGGGQFPRNSREQGIRLKFLIQDSGIGVPPDQLERIFEPFAAVASGGRIRSGLDLTLCERLSFLMGGRITARSKLATGTTFELVLPMLVATAPDVENELPEAIEGDSAPGARASGQPAAEPDESRPILIVDDNRLARVMTASLLAESGYTVDQAEDQTEALALCEQKNYQAVVTDYRMPECNGTDLAILIRERCAGSNLTPTLLLLTAGITDDEMARARTVFDGVLIKPISTVQLVKTIRAMEQVGARLG
ncbi:MAG: ATP-binding response regulator [Burkholderiaceae bacterium]